MPLVVCPTPIGNLDDVTLRALAELRAADVVLCEDTRRTRILLDRHGIAPPRVLSYHRHNEARRVQELLPALAEGARVALVSDAGMPGISDPGARIVAAALEADVALVVLPGPSAVETALVASGFSGGPFRFLGYLPRREAELTALWQALCDRPEAAVAFESPNRLPASLRSLAAADPERPVAVCRELTKRFEEIVRGPARQVAALLPDPVKGEVTLVLGPAGAPPERPGEESAALDAVRELVSAGVPRRRAVDVVARLTGVPRNALYRRSL
ncbi:MAG TPA: 16S rRNA (cytidine(1402)-2'-O)-methyltransferase [Gaiellaceae bacterium]|nr:16S rRNA (cytidine(1402)-2'-O)-methyltransferase [Gaiellaceae bacterium]